MYCLTDKPRGGDILLTVSICNGTETVSCFFGAECLNQGCRQRRRRWRGCRCRGRRRVNHLLARPSLLTLRFPTPLLPDGLSYRFSLGLSRVQVPCEAFSRGTNTAVMSIATTSADASDVAPAAIELPRNTVHIVEPASGTTSTTYNDHFPTPIFRYDGFDEPPSLSIPSSPLTCSHSQLTQTSKIQLPKSCFLSCSTPSPVSTLPPPVHDVENQAMNVHPIKTLMRKYCFSP